MLSPVETIQVVTFLDFLAAGLIVPQVPPQARSLGGNLVTVGLIGSLYAGFQLLSGPLTGYFSDLKGASQTLLVSLCLSGAAYVLLGVVNSIFMFLILRSFLGLTKHTQLLTKTILPAYTRDENELSQAYGRIYLIKQAGLILGPIVSGHIMEAFSENGFTIIAFIVGAIFAVNSGLVRNLPNMDKKEGKKDQKKDKDSNPIAPALLNVTKTSLNQSVDQFNKINWEKYGDIFSFKILISVCVGVFLTNYVLFMNIKHGVSPVTTGYIISALSATGSVASFFVAQINTYYEKDKDFTERTLHVFALLTLSLIGVAFAPEISLYAVFIIPLSVASTIGNLVTQEVVLYKTDGDRGDVLDVMENVRSGIGIIAPLLSGVLGHYFGVLRVVYVSILLAAVGTYKSYVIRTKSIETVIEAKKK